MICTAGKKDKWYLPGSTFRGGLIIYTLVLTLENKQMGERHQKESLWYQKFNGIQK